MSMLSFGLQHNLVEVTKLDDDTAFTLLFSSLNCPNQKIWRDFYIFILTSRKKNYTAFRVTNTPSDLTSKHALIHLRTGDKNFTRTQIENANKMEKNIEIKLD